MNCADYREWISASLDRRLGAAETEQLAAHLAGCPECRHAHEETEAGDAMLRRIAKIDLPAGFEDRVMAIAAREDAAPRRRGSLLAPLFTCAVAAALLVVLGLALVVPTPPRTDSKVGENLGATEAFIDLGQSLPATDPKKEGELVRVQMAALCIKERTEELKLELAKDPEGQVYVAAIEALVKLADKGDVVELRDRARQIQLSAALRRGIAVRTPDAAQATFATSVPAEYRNAVTGHLHYLNGQYDRAIADFNGAIELEPTRLWRADAWSAAGNVEQAVVDYTAVLNAARTDPSAVNSLRGRMRGARRYSLWFGEHPVENVSDVQIAGAIKESDVAFCFATESGKSFTIFTPEKNMHWPKLKGVQLSFPHEGVVRVEGELREVVETNPVGQVELLRKMVERSTREK